MRGIEIVDDLYGAFVETLHGPLAAYAHGLASSLLLAPRVEPESQPPPRWSRIVSHEVTLAAPDLFADAMPHVSPAAVRDAVAAQTFAAIEALGTSRIEEGHVPSTLELLAVLGHLRRASARMLVRVCPGVVDPALDPEAAHRRMLAALTTARLARRKGTVFDRCAYEALAADKHGVKVLPSIALSWAAGWDSERRRSVERALRSVFVGLEMSEDDPSNGPRALWHMRSARRRALALGALRLAGWAREREERLSSLGSRRPERDEWARSWNASS